MRIVLLILTCICYFYILFLLNRMIGKTYSIQSKRLPSILLFSFGLLPIFCIIDYLHRGNTVIEIFAFAGYLFIGFFIYYILSLGTLLLGQWILRKIKKTHRTYHPILIPISALMSVLICCYGILSAQIPAYTTCKMHLNLATPMKVVVVSDIHYGATGSLLSLESMVKNLNQTDADVVFLVGDVFDNKISCLDHSFFASIMQKIKSKYGVYAITGNHEFYTNSLKEIESFYEESGVRLLVDEEITLNQQLRILGRMDSSQKRKRVEDMISESTLPLLILDHQPQFFKEAMPFAALQISGHTHNGQIFPGNFFIALLNLIAFQSPSNGIHQYNSLTLAITRGYGTWGIPMRSTGSSQILIFELD